MKDINEEYEKSRGIIAEGIRTEFWKEIKSMLTDLKENARTAILDADPSQPGIVAQYQQMFKISEMIVSIVESLAEEQQAIDKKKIDKMKKEE